MLRVAKYSNSMYVLLRVGFGFWLKNFRLDLFQLTSICSTIFDRHSDALNLQRLKLLANEISDMLNCLYTDIEQFKIMMTNWDLIDIIRNKHRYLTLKETIFLK